MTDNKARRSARQPVPNPIYQHGITQLKSVILFSFSKTLCETNEGTNQLMMKMSAMKRGQILSSIMSHLWTTMIARNSICPVDCQMDLKWESSLLCKPRRKKRKRRKKKSLWQWVRKFQRPWITKNRQDCWIYSFLQLIMWMKMINNNTQMKRTPCPKPPK